MKQIRFTFLVIFFLSGCSRAGLPAPTAMPPEYLPTAVALTAAALASPIPAEVSPTASLTPTITPTPTLTPTPTPTASLTPTAGPIAPLPAIRFVSPGAMSKVTSPIILKAYARPGANRQIQIELLGEDGRLLAREILRRESILEEGAYLNIQIPFETRAAAELGRLQISTKDEYGRPLETASVHLLLLSVGADELNPGDSEYARADFYYPQVDDDVYGGRLPLVGEFQAFNDTPVHFELVSETGKILGLRSISMTAGERKVFEALIPYDVDEPTSARLTIRQEDERFVGSIYLHSQIVILNP